MVERLIMKEKGERMKQKAITILAFIAAAALLVSVIALMSFRTQQAAAICYPIMAISGVILALLRGFEYYQKKKAGEDTGLASVILTGIVALYLVVSCVLPLFGISNIR